MTAKQRRKDRNALPYLIIPPAHWGEPPTLHIPGRITERKLEAALEVWRTFAPHDHR